MSYLIVWEFHVPAEKRAAFVRRYSSDGDWAELFRRSSEYQGTELLADDTDPERFYTIDRWAASGAWERFQEVHAADYAALDKRCEGLTRTERRLGGGVAT